MKNCCNQQSVAERWLKLLTVFYLVLSGCVCISKEHTACPLGMDFWSEAVVAEAWRPMLCSFQGALLQCEFVDWDHGGAHWDSLSVVFAYDGMSTHCPSGAFVVCWLAKLCTSMVLVNILGYVNDYSPGNNMVHKVRTFKGNVKSYRLKLWDQSTNSVDWRIWQSSFMKAKANGMVSQG